MYRKPGTVFILTVAVLCAGVTFAPLGAFGQKMPRANVVTVEGATTTYHVTDMGGKQVVVNVPSQSMTDIRTKHQGSARPGSQSGQATGTIPAEVVAVDTQTNMVKVRTQAGQIIKLEMMADGIQIGEQLTLVVPQ
jgi:hypothetical protein